MSRDSGSGLDTNEQQGKLQAASARTWQDFSTNIFSTSCNISTIKNTWIWLTPEGLRTVAQELGELRPYTPTPAKVNHLYWCNHARLYVEQLRKDATWVSERQARASRKSEPGVKQPHIPDAIVTSNGHDIALEVELSTKTYPRLEKILQELAESDYYTVWYFTLGRATRVVETAIDAMQDIDKSRFAVYDVEETELE